MADEAEVAAEPLEQELAPWGRVIYSLATLALPLLMFLAMMAVIKGLFTDAYMEQLTKAVETEDSWASYGQLVAQQKAALAIAEFVARIRFAAPQALLISISYVTIAIAIAVAAAVVRAHGRLGPELGLVALAVVCVTIAAIWIVNHNGLNLRIGNLSLYIIPHVLERVQFEGATQLPALMEARSAYGASVGFAAAGAVVLAAAMLAYRWRRPGIWFRPLVLRRQMNCLLVLFAVASILLVFSNTAVRSLVEWPAGLLKPSATVARAAAAPASARPGAAGVQAPAEEDTTDAAGLADTLRGSAASLSYLWSIASTAILLVTFAPPFVSLFLDIERAGTAALRRGKGDAGEAEVTYRELKTWKDDNGLTLSFGEITTAALATAAPLFTAPVVDLTKTTCLPNGRARRRARRKRHLTASAISIRFKAPPAGRSRRCEGVKRCEAGIECSPPARSPAPLPSPPAPTARRRTIPQWDAVDAALGRVQGACARAFALARIRLDQALADTSWTAAPAEQTGDYQDLPPAVVLDLDETLLDNSAYQAWMVISDKTFTAETGGSSCSRRSPARSRARSISRNTPTPRA